MSKFRGFNRDPFRAERRLPYEAMAIAIFDVSEIQTYPAMSFVLRPDEAINPELGVDLQAMLDTVRGLYPRHSIDATVHREPFRAGQPEDLPTHMFGIHKDSFEDGIFILSTDEPTMLYDDIQGTNPVQLLPGEFARLTGDCAHSAPNPTHDGERVRIKLIPLAP